MTTIVAGRRGPSSFISAKISAALSVSCTGTNARNRNSRWVTAKTPRTTSASRPLSPRRSPRSSTVGSLRAKRAMAPRASAAMAMNCTGMSSALSVSLAAWLPASPLRTATVEPMMSAGMTTTAHQAFQVVRCARSPFCRGTEYVTEE
ncbi:hypothetical protein ACUXNS_000541 [Brevibacterium pityocampae]